MHVILAFANYAFTHTRTLREPPNSRQAMAILMSSWPLILGAMDAASLGMMSGSLVISKNSWRSAPGLWVQEGCGAGGARGRRGTQQQEKAVGEAVSAHRTRLCGTELHKAAANLPRRLAHQQALCSTRRCTPTCVAECVVGVCL